MGYRDQTPPTTPERVRSEAQQTERDQRILESPERHRTPHHVRMARSGVSIAPIPPPVFVPPTIVPLPAPIYRNLDTRLAQQYAALPDLYPRRQPSIAPVPAPQLAPAFVPAPAQYTNIPDLAQRYAALPPLIERGRGRGSRGRGRPALPPLTEHGIGRGRGNTPTASAPPMSYTELAARYAALPSVCNMFYFICRDKADFCTQY